MKKKILSALAFSILVGFSGCDSFLDLDPLDKVSGDKLTETAGGIKALLSNVYVSVPMEDFVFRPYTGYNARNYDGVNGSSNIAFLSDEAARSEGGGGIIEGFEYWDRGYQDNRQVNIFIETIKSSREKGIINEEDAERMTAEARFARAYIYYGLAKRYGGVPIIDRVQDGDYVPGDTLALRVLRSTEVDTWKFIVTEFGEAAKALPEAKDGYRFTKWAALAMKSRTALFAASLAKYWDKAPLAGKAVTEKLVGIDKSEAAYFYNECIAASEEIINNSGKSLYRPNPASVAEAISNYQQLFLATPDEEVILARGYIDGTTNTNQGHSWSLYYNLSQVNPGALHYGRFSPTADLVDLYEDYTDDGTGKSAPIRTRSDNVEQNVANVQLEGSIKPTDPYIKYDNLSSPFVGKDARLQASIIVPGATFAGTKIVMQGGLIDQSGKVSIYSNSTAKGKDGKDYYGFGAPSPANYSGFAELGNSQNGNFTTSGFSVRKYMEEFKTLSSNWNSITTPFIDIRLAEVYLNYAEAVVESGKGDAALAAKCLNDLRHRAAHTDNIPLTLTNVLKERRVELAFESKRYWDMIRRRENHQYFNSGMRSALVPMVDLREATPKYIFVRANFHGDELQNGRTFAPQSYYRAIQGTSTNGLIQNPEYN